MINTIIQFGTSILDENKAKWDITINIPVGCPYMAVKEASCQCIKWIGQLEDEQKARQEQQQAQEVPMPPETDIAPIESEQPKAE